MVLGGTPEEGKTFKTIKNECFMWEVWLALQIINFYSHKKPITVFKTLPKSHFWHEKGRFKGYLLYKVLVLTWSRFKSSSLTPLNLLFPKVSQILYLKHSFFIVLKVFSSSGDPLKTILLTLYSVFTVFK